MNYRDINRLDFLDSELVSFSFSSNTKEVKLSLNYCGEIIDYLMTNKSLKNLDYISHRFNFIFTDVDNYVRMDYHQSVISFLNNFENIKIPYGIEHISIKKENSRYHVRLFFLDSYGICEFNCLNYEVCNYFI